MVVCSMAMQLVNAGSGHDSSIRTHCLAHSRILASRPSSQRAIQNCATRNSGTEPVGLRKLMFLASVVEVREPTATAALTTYGVFCKSGDLHKREGVGWTPLRWEPTWDATPTCMSQQSYRHCPFSEGASTVYLVAAVYLSMQRQGLTCDAVRSLRNQACTNPCIHIPD